MFSNGDIRLMLHALTHWISNNTLVQSTVSTQVPDLNGSMLVLTSLKINGNSELLEKMSVLKLLKPISNAWLPITLLH